ncbi:MAG: hypothetical protein AB8B78_03110 [Polaribacter sp.]
MIIGLLCFMIIGGGSMRFRNKTINLHSSIDEDLIVIGMYLLIPVLGFVLMKVGYTIVSKNHKNK